MYENWSYPLEPIWTYFNLFSESAVIMINIKLTDPFV